jgi:hypothetical protein
MLENLNSENNKKIKKSNKPQNKQDANLEIQHTSR